MSIKITSDSTCDLTPEMIRKLSVTIFPLTIIMDGVARKDGADIHPQDIFNHVDAGGDLCSTSAVSPAEYAEKFKLLSAQYDAVIHVNIGKEFSSCYQNARIAAAELKNVYVVDSANLSSGHGHLVVEAALMARSGLPPEEIVARLNDLAPRVEASFVLDRLDYMHKGGRCSSVAALGANLLKLKPCIEVRDGKMQVGKKYRGTFDKCLQQYVRDRLQGREGLNLSRIFITHPSAPPNTVKMARAEIQKYARFGEIVETRAGCTVSAHCGPNTLGILFINE